LKSSLLPCLNHSAKIGIRCPKSWDKLQLFKNNFKKTSHIQKLYGKSALKVPFYGEIGNYSIFLRIFVWVIDKFITMDKKLNRIKTVLVDKGKTNKWLAEQLGKDPATISKWCTNKSQPSLVMMMTIAKLLQVELSDLVRLEEIEDPVVRKKTEGK